jgi:chromosome partitioning protein
MAIIAVFNQQAGVGKTTTSLSLLAAIARSGRRPLAIDLDPQAQLSRVFGARPLGASDSLAGFFLQQAALDDVAQITRSGVVVCPGHADLAQADAQLGKSLDAITRLRRALRRPRPALGPVVIDCCALLNVLSLNAIFACDLLLVPVCCNLAALQAARAVDRALNALEPVFKRRLPRRFLLTRADPAQGLTDGLFGQLRESLRSEELCATWIREDAQLADSLARELDGFRDAPPSSGAQDYASLFDELRPLLDATGSPGDPG